MSQHDVGSLQRTWNVVAQRRFCVRTSLLRPYGVAFASVRQALACREAAGTEFVRTWAQVRAWRCHALARVGEVSALITTWLHELGVRDEPAVAAGPLRWHGRPAWGCVRQVLYQRGPKLEPS